MATKRKAKKPVAAKSARPDVYQIVTDRVIDLLNNGVIPWHKPWSGGSANAPKNLISKKPYRGVNVFLLGAMGYQSPYWLTFNQAKSLGGSVRKGEKGTPVVFWNWVEKASTPEEKAKTGKDRVRIPFLRYYTVFNLAQVDGIPAEKIPVVEVKATNSDPIESAEAIAKAYTAVPIRHGFDHACYYPALDAIDMPDRADFGNPEAYYSTLFHEMGHSTGHESRLARKGVVDRTLFGSHAYSQEELVAEMTATFLCAEADIVHATIENSAAYIHHWLTKLRDDRKLLVTAAAQAQKAADLILNRAKPAVTEGEAATPAPTEIEEAA